MPWSNEPTDQYSNTDKHYCENETGSMHMQVAQIADSQAGSPVDQKNIKIPYRSNIYIYIYYLFLDWRYNVITAVATQYRYFLVTRWLLEVHMKNPVATVYHFSPTIEYYKGTYY